MIERLPHVLLVVGSSVELSIAVKATLVITLGLVAGRLARRACASTRHLIMAATFVGLLILPLGAMLAPVVAIEIPIAVTDTDSARLASTPRGGAATSPAGLGAPMVMETNRRSRVTWSNAIRAGWAAGATLLLLWLGIAVWRSSRLRRRGLPWPESRPVVAALAARIGIGRAVEVMLHEALAAPATCGWRRPAILLPADAAEWDEGDLRRALVHELEHVRRGDWAVHLMARAMCSVFWFHPLAWIAFRQLCLEAERACDDAVLEHAEHTAYAAQLVQLARRMSNMSIQSTLSMADRSDLSTRVSAILDSAQQRGRLGLMRAVAVLVVAITMVMAVAPVRAVGVYPGNRLVAAAQHGNQARTVPGRRVAALNRALSEAAEQGDIDDVAGPPQRRCKREGRHRGRRQHTHWSRAQSRLPGGPEHDPTASLPTIAKAGMMPIAVAG